MESGFRPSPPPSPRLPSSLNYAATGRRDKKATAGQVGWGVFEKVLIAVSVQLSAFSWRALLAVGLVAANREWAVGALVGDLRQSFLFF